MSKKQSSIDWLIEEIKKDLNLRLRGFDIDKALEQAKAMHKEEIEEAYYYDPNSDEIKDDGEEYYNKTFGGQDNE